MYVFLDISAKLADYLSLRRINMDASGIWIGLADLPTYSPAFQAELRDRLFGSAPVTPPAAAGSDPNVPELTHPQAEAVLEGSRSEAVIATLREVVRRKGEFTYLEFLGQLELTTEEMRGVWSGITKLVRAATGNKQARLLRWKKREDIWHGSVPAASVAALRTALANF
jgi:hypothetical protein